MCPNLAYRRGANFERRVRDYFAKQGCAVFRSAGSHSPADLIVLKAGEVILVQCQLDKYFAPNKRQALIILGEELDCQVCLAWREKRKLRLEVL